MTLALRLGRTLGELRESIDTYELSLWREFDRRSPIGDEREDIRNAHLAATVARAAGSKVTAADMLLRWEPREKPAGALPSGAANFKAFLMAKAVPSKT